MTAIVRVPQEIQAYCEYFFCNQTDLPCDNCPIYHSRCLSDLMSIRLYLLLG